MTFARQQLGKSGEDLAVAELEARGYAIVARRYRTARGEIDIVAEHDDTLVFVEVKARAGNECGRAVDAVTRRKQLRLAAMAAEYLARNGIADRACRFDVVAIDDMTGTPAIEVFANAFEVD